MTKCRVGWIAAGSLLCASAAAAQTAPAGPARPGPSRPGVAAPDVTGSFSGRVVDFTTGEPVAGALVQIGGPSPAAKVVAEDGTFEFAGLPHGSYDATARRNGYLPDFG